MRSRLWWRDQDDELDAVIPYLRLSGGNGKGRVSARLELPSPPPAIDHIARSIRRPCVGCGQEIDVFRTRSVGFPGGKVQGAAYMSILCTRPSCTHGAARGYYADLIEHLIRSKPRQDSLFEAQR